LLGQPAGGLSVPVGNLRDSVRILEMPEVLPADVLSRRPDVLKAEYGVLQAHHLVGKARLARLPTFSLTGAAKTGQSFTSTVINTWTFGLAANWAGLFDRDLKIDVKLSEADVKIAREEYRKIVLEAYEEVEIALLNLNARQEQIKQLEAQVADLQVVRNVQDARLREGLVSQVEVFDTERSLLGAQQEILSTYQQLLSDTVTLYKALGGGWESERPGERPKVADSKSVK
jgi:outer membrane protein TolC